MCLALISLLLVCVSMQLLMFQNLCFEFNNLNGIKYALVNFRLFLDSQLGNNVVRYSIQRSIRDYPYAHSRTVSLFLDHILYRLP